MAEEEYFGDENFEQMLEESMTEVQVNELTDGKVVSITEEFVLVDVGEKVEGRIRIEEFIECEGGECTVKEGDDICVLVVGKSSERPQISFKKAQKKKQVVEFINKHKDDYEGMIVEGEVVRKVKAGYVVSDGEVEFFLPKNESALKDDKKNLGKHIKAAIINIKPEKDSIIISRKAFFDIENEEKSKKVAHILESRNEPLKGIVKKLTSFGMFVDVAGVEGLVHYSEISYKGPVNPAKYYKEGDEVIVKVLDYEEKKSRLSLSVKAVYGDPWDEIKDELEVGDTIKVTVSNIEPYGAFVDLGNDIEGFLHVSEVSWDKNVKTPGDYLKVNEEINVEVIEISTEKKRLRVSLRNLLPKPFEEFSASHKQGDVIKGEVTTVTDFGAFVKIGRVEGLLHNEDAFWEIGKKCKDEFKVGDEIEVKIIKIDPEKERISLSQKELKESPAEQFSKKYNLDDVVTGKVRDIKDFGVFVSLDEGIDALIRNDDLYPLKKEEIESGQEIEAMVTMIDENTNKIRLSVKRAVRANEKEKLQSINDKEDSKMTLGDIIKDKMDK
jgi:small subunit ribosomal protein S1